MQVVIDGNSCIKQPTLLSVSIDDKEALEADLLSKYKPIVKEIFAHVEPLLRNFSEGQPMLLGITGGVGAGKTICNKALANFIISEFPEITVNTVSTDAFLYPNNLLLQIGLFNIKGFPETFDWHKLKRFLVDIKENRNFQENLFEYSQVAKDISDQALNTYFNPEHKTLFLLEGVNLSFCYGDDGDRGFIPTNLLDCCIYLDPDIRTMKARMVRRFEDAFKNAKSAPQPPEYFKHLMRYSDDQVRSHVEKLWRTINLRLLKRHIISCKHRADLVVKF